MSHVTVETQKQKPGSQVTEIWCKGRVDTAGKVQHIQWFCERDMRILYIIDSPLSGGYCGDVVVNLLKI
jgi:hypothetical protein